MSSELSDSSSSFDPSYSDGNSRLSLRANKNRKRLRRLSSDETLSESSMNNDEISVEDSSSGEEKKTTKPKKENNSKRTKKLNDSEMYDSEGFANFCAICKDDGFIILCDECKNGYHTSCLLLEEVPPTASWICPLCTELQRRKYVKSAVSPEREKPLISMILNSKKAKGDQLNKSLNKNANSNSNSNSKTDSITDAKTETKTETNTKQSGTKTSPKLIQNQNQNHNRNLTSTTTSTSTSTSTTTSTTSSAPKPIPKQSTQPTHQSDGHDISGTFKRAHMLSLLEELKKNKLTDEMKKRIIAEFNYFTMNGLIDDALNIIEAFPSSILSVSLYIEKAKCYFLLGNYQAAISCANNAIDLKINLFPAFVFIITICDLSLSEPNSDYFRKVRHETVEKFVRMNKNQPRADAMERVLKTFQGNVSASDLPQIKEGTKLSPQVKFLLKEMKCDFVRLSFTSQTHIFSDSDPSQVQQACKCQVLGKKAMENHEYSNAISWFSASIALDPSVGLFFSNRSAALICIKDYDSALCDARTAVSLSPTLSFAFENLGASLFFLGNFSSAIRAGFMNAFYLNPCVITTCKLLNAIKKARDPKYEFKPAVRVIIKESWIQELGNSESIVK